MNNIFETGARTLKLAAMCFLAMVIFVGCSKDEDVTSTTNTTNNAPFAFLKVGNEWVYEVYDGTNNELLGTYRWDILLYTPSAAKPDGYEVHLSTYELGYDNGMMYGLADKDLWVIGGYVPDNCSVFLDRDCYIEKEWELDFFCKGTAKIISLNETVTVPAGTFSNCIKIEVQNSDGLKNYYWVHKDFGNIMAEENNRIYKLKSKNF